MVVLTTLLMGILLSKGTVSIAETWQAGTDYRLTDFTLPETLAQDWQRMHAGKRTALEKFNDDKFGMFVHWGLYSVPGGQWKGKRVPGLGEWIMWHAMIPRAQYAELGKQFNPLRFDATEWVTMARQAGMKYIVITAKHHDGFALYSSKYSTFNIGDATPCAFEPLDRLYEECQKQGIGLGFYYSHVIDWYDGWSGEGGWPGDNPAQRRGKSNPMNTWDPSGRSREHYLRDKSFPQVRELLERYPNTYSIWFDYWHGNKYINPPESYAFYKTVYDAQPRCLVNGRVGHDLGDYLTAPDNGLLATGQRKQWETPGTLNNTWGYSQFDDDWKSETELIYWLVNIVSRGGNYLLNIGPKPDGSIPAGTKTGLAAIGRWMKVNGDAVYGTTAWDIVSEGTAEASFKVTTERREKGFKSTFTSGDIWFTAKGSAVYAIALQWPADRKALVKSVNAKRIAKIQRVSLLGYGPLENWTLNPTGLSVSLPDADLNTIGYTLKIEIGP